MDVLVMQVIVVLTNCYIATTEKKKNIYIVTFLFNFFNLLMYLFNKDMTTAIIYIVISARSFIYIYKDKLKSVIIPIICILTQLIVGFTAINNIWQLIPIFTPCLVCYYMWFSKTTQQLRVWNAICNGLWCIYNLRTSLYIVAISRAITVVTNLIAYFYYKDKETKGQ